MHRGYFRLGVVLTAIWIAIVVGGVIYQYWSRNIFCQFDASTVTDSVCQHFFWAWVPMGTEAQFSVEVPQLLAATLVPVVAGWLLAFAAVWVRKGFQEKK